MGPGAIWALYPGPGNLGFHPLAATAAVGGAPRRSVSTLLSFSPWGAPAVKNYATKSRFCQGKNNGLERNSLERQYILAKELQKRRENDALFTWKPHPKQQEFIDSVLGTECYTNYAVWANRSGKSDVGAYCGSMLARFGLRDHEIKPAVGPNTVVYDRATSGWVVGLTANMLRDTIAPKYFDNGFVPAGQPHEPFIPKREWLNGDEGWRVSDKILRLKNGSIIGFKSIADGRQTFQGAGKDWIHFDEEPELECYKEATLRIEAGRRLRVFCTCTLLPPAGQVGGVTWLYTEKCKPYLAGENVSWRVFQASIYDNPHLPREDVAMLESQYPPGSIERRIRLEGQLLPGLSGALAYGNFNTNIHMVDPGPIDLRRPLCVACDFNVGIMIWLIGQYIGGVFRVYKELVTEDKSVEDMTKLFRQEYPSHRAEVWVYGDATGKSDNAQTAQSCYQLLFNQLRGYPVPTVMKVPAKNPFVTDRINAVNRALMDEYGEPRVEIHPSCVETRLDLEGVFRDPKGGLHKEYDRSKPYYRRTHASDSLGYWICQVQPVTGEPIKAPHREYQVSQSYSGRKRPSYSFTHQKEKSHGSYR